MAVYRLPKELEFPSPTHADSDGLLAIGGDLSPKRLLKAYRLGIFPWYNADEPIYWWSPDPRSIIAPSNVHISQRLARVIRSKRYTISYDTVFDTVIEQCAQSRRTSQKGTWITPAMQEAYSTLHLMGNAHSIESWNDGKLVGGLYGISIGGVFFGESMFSHQTDASKVAFASLAQQLHLWGFDLIDCQVHSKHLAQFGAQPLPRELFLKQLIASVNQPDRWMKNPSG